VCWAVSGRARSPLFWSRRGRGCDRRSAARLGGRTGRYVAVLLAPRLDGTYLAIQGPPGSRPRDHRRGDHPGVGQERPQDRDNRNLAQSHLQPGSTSSSGRRSSARVRPGHPEGTSATVASPEVQCTGSAQRRDGAQRRDVDVVAGTSCYSRGHLSCESGLPDRDEAGQMALANVLAMAGVTRNFIFLGPEPAQPAQPWDSPTRREPFGAGSVIQDEPPLPVDYGLFLETSYRLHPSVLRLYLGGFLRRKTRTRPINDGQGPRDEQW